MDFKVGDVVVLVRGGRIPCPNTPNVFHRGDSLPAITAILRVSEVSNDVLDTGPLAGQFCGCASLHFADGTWGCESRFRHLPKASDEFTAQMRNLRPVKDQVHG